MRGAEYATALHLAGMLAAGAEAEVVGGDVLAGTQVWVDEEMQVWQTSRKAADGVLVRSPDGRTALFVTADRARAESLLARTREILPARGPEESGG